jgi:hypothetical protein
MGFMNFALSISLLFFSLGAYKRGSKAFYVFTLLLFASHAAVYGLFVIILLGFYKESQKRNRYMMGYAMALLVLFIGSLVLSPGHGQTSDKSSSSFIVEGIIFILLLVYGIWTNINASLFNAFQFFRPDYLGLLAFAFLAGLYGKQIFLEERRYSKPILFASALILFITVFFPPAIPVGSSVWNTFNGRFLPIAMLFVITDLRIGKKQEKAIIGVFLILAFINS